MNVYDFIDNMIARLDGLTVKGAENCAIIIQTIRDLNSIKSAITVEKEKEDEDGESDNQQG